MKTRSMALVFTGWVGIAAAAVACGGESSNDGAGSAGSGGASGSAGSPAGSAGGGGQSPGSGQPGSLCASSSDFASCQSCCRMREPLGATYFDLLRSCKCIACVLECSSTLCSEPETAPDPACRKCMEANSDSCAVAAQGCADRPECAAIVACEAEECAAAK